MFFMLPNYAEKQIQFGVIHSDLTPRPAYVALAAVGRLLADAKPLGKLKSEKRSAHAFLFRARPDGREQLVLVAWSDLSHPQLPLPTRPTAAFDHLGRPRATTADALELSSAPVYLLFPMDLLGKFVRELPPRPAARLGRRAVARGSASRVVRAARVAGPLGLPRFRRQGRADSDLRVQFRPPAGDRAVIGCRPTGMETEPAGPRERAARRACRIGVGGRFARRGIAHLPAGDHPRRFPVGRYADSLVATASGSRNRWE